MPDDVKSAEEAEYNKPGVADLLILLTEATRAQQDSVPGVFIPPAGIEQVESKYHHIIFGQRGSGKSSLLRYLERLMRQQRRVTAWIDQEIFAQLEYPDVLVSCVLEITDGIIESLPRNKKSKVGILARFGRAGNNGLEAQLTRIAENLRVLKFARWPRSRRRWSWPHGSLVLPAAVLPGPGTAVTRQMAWGAAGAVRVFGSVVLVVPGNGSHSLRRAGPPAPWRIALRV
jgi:hypothetical protein